MPWLKHLHVTFVALSLSGFLWRAGVRIRTGRKPSGLWGRTLPDLNDTLLLATGLGMMLLYGWRPWVQLWLGAKLVGLVIYIVLGAIALRRGSRAAALAAVLVFAYIATVAVTKNPVPLP